MGRTHKCQVHMCSCKGPMLGAEDSPSAPSHKWTPTSRTVTPTLSSTDVDSSVWTVCKGWSSPWLLQTRPLSTPVLPVVLLPEIPAPFSTPAGILPTRSGLDAVSSRKPAHRSAQNSKSSCGPSIFRSDKGLIFSFISASQYCLSQRPQIHVTQEC